MAILPIDLDTITLDGIRVLVHSIRAGGKTHLLGDFLTTEAKEGPVAYINTDGEGYMTLQGSGLGKAMYRVSNLKEYNEVVKEFAAKPLQAIAVDSAQILEQFCFHHVVGTDARSPKGGTSQGSVNEWAEISREFYNALRYTRKAAKMLMVSCPSSINADPVTGAQKIISPDLSGQRALGIAGIFEFVGYIKMMVTSPGNVKRLIQFAPDGSVLVRQQKREAIKADIELPKVGGWQAIKNAILK